MTKANKLKICNITLLLVALPMLISSIQMEVCGGKPLANIGAHVKTSVSNWGALTKIWCIHDSGKGKSLYLCTHGTE